jgi:hypothetical protein
VGRIHLAHADVPVKHVEELALDATHVALAENTCAEMQARSRETSGPRTLLAAQWSVL